MKPLLILSLAILFFGFTFEGYPREARTNPCPECPKGCTIHGYSIPAVFCGPWEEYTPEEGFKSTMGKCPDPIPNYTCK